MKLVCPACNVAFPIEAGLADAQAREAVALAFALPAPIGDRLLRYLALFRPRARVLSWDRVARLLGELHEAIRAGRIERKGRAWVAPMAVWEAALDDILDKREKLQLPLKTHGYLFEIVAGMAGKAEGAQEQREIERASHPAHRDLTKATEKPTDPKVAAAAVDLLKKITRPPGA